MAVNQPPPDDSTDDPVEEDGQIIDEDLDQTTEVKNDTVEA